MANTDRERGNPISKSGAHVATNVKRIRQHLGLTQAQLSERLSFHPIPPASIGKLEAQRRKVEVDDLMALAVALEVSPLTLLLPEGRRPSEGVEITGFAGEARDVWAWGVGEVPLDVDAHDQEELSASVDAFRHRAVPWWARAELWVPSDNLPSTVRDRELERFAEYETERRDRAQQHNESVHNPGGIDG